MSSEWAPILVVAIIKGKCANRNCSCYRGVSLFEHAMKVMEKVLEKRLHRIVTVNEMQFVFMSEKGTI